VGIRGLRGFAPDQNQIGETGKSPNCRRVRTLPAHATEDLLCLASPLRACGAARAQDCSAGLIRRSIYNCTRVARGIRGLKGFAPDQNQIGETGKSPNCRRVRTLPAHATEDLLCLALPPRASVSSALRNAAPARATSTPAMATPRIGVYAGLSASLRSIRRRSAGFDVRFSARRSSNRSSMRSPSSANISARAE
jgi:hypothetical protein